MSIITLDVGVFKFGKTMTFLKKIISEYCYVGQYKVKSLKFSFI